jgi:hypothetical protein
VVSTKARQVARPGKLAARGATRGQSSALSIGPIALAVVVVAVIGGAVGYTIGKPDATKAAIADIQAAEAKRDLKQIAELTTLARTTISSLTPVLAALDKALPTQKDAVAQPATEAQVTQWQQAVDAASAAFAETLSGTTATNVARGGLRAAVDQLVICVRTYALSGRLTGAEQQRLRQLAADQRNVAVATWGVAATQLDAINISAGYGHQHAYLPSSGGGFTPDGAPEGSS